MPRGHHSQYPDELRRGLVEPVRAWKSPEELARQCEPSVQTIRSWVGLRFPILDQGRRSSSK